MDAISSYFSTILFQNQYQKGGMFTTQTQLSFSSNLSISKFQVIEVNQQFINQLRSKGEIVIDGSEDNRVQFFTETQTYKVSKINLPTTILITEPTGNIVRQASGYLSIQKCCPSLKVVFDGLKKYYLTEMDYKMNSLEQIVQERGLYEGQLCYRFKISHKQLREFMSMAHNVECQGRWLIISQKLFNSVFHHLVIYLTSNNLIMQRFTLESVANKLDICVHPEVLAATLRKFGCETDTQTFQITLSSITKFVLNEMAAVKREYLKEEFDGIFQKLLAIYAPEGVEIPKESPQIAQYFLFIKDNGGIYSYYNILQMPTTATEMVLHLSKIKMRYNYNEAVNIFRLIYKGKSIDEAIVKHFRKYAKDYELKGVFTM